MSGVPPGFGLDNAPGGIHKLSGVDGSKALPRVFDYHRRARLVLVPEGKIGGTVYLMDVTCIYNWQTQKSSSVSKSAE